MPLLSENVPKQVDALFQITSRWVSVICTHLFYFAAHLSIQAVVKGARKPVGTVKY